MATVVVLGAGLAGLSAAVLLARDGHTVTVLERDSASVAPAEDAWEKWERPGVSQFRLGHLMLPRWYREIGELIPEVLEELEASGGRRFNFVGDLPESMRGPHRPGDARFETMAARRPVLEAVVGAVAERTADLVVRRGVTVTGLITAERTRRDGIPQVAGVVTRDGESIRADLVVDCCGRRTPTSRWLAALGAKSPLEEREESGLVYYARHFRSRSGDHPEARVPFAQDYNSVTMVLAPADRGTWSLLVVARTDDHALRGLREPGPWQAALSRYPMLAHWASGDDVEPITGVQVMPAKDRHRSLVVDDRPVATGFVAVGDAWSSTNPWQGRGTTIGLLHARLLRQLLRENDPADREGFARCFHEHTLATVEPLYRATLRADRQRLAEIASDIAGTPHRPSDRNWPLSLALRTAVLTDGDALRAAVGVIALNEDARAALRAPGFAERVMALAGDADQYPLPGPSRTELLDTVHAAI